MQPQSNTPANDRLFNLVQIVVLDVALTVTLAAALKLLGASWLVTIAGAWIGGCLLTLSAVFTTYFVRNRHEARQNGLSQSTFEADAPALVPTNIQDPVQLWDADRLMELDFAVAHKASDPLRRPRRQSQIAMVPMWEDSADTDHGSVTGSGHIAPMRPQRSDRRQNEDSIEESERRISGR